MNNLAINLAILALGMLIAPSVEDYVGSPVYVIAALVIAAALLKIFAFTRTGRRGSTSRPI